LNGALVVGAVILAGFVILVTVILKTSPMADDYEYLPMVHSMGFASFLHLYWNGVTDRYSNGIWEFATVRLFGIGALKVMPLTLLAALGVFGVSTVRALANRVGVTASRVEWLSLGTLGVVALVGTAPSLLDTLAWFNSVGFYLASVVALAGLVTWICRSAITSRRPLALDAAIALTIAGIAAGFMEAEAAITVAVGVAALVTAHRLGASRRLTVLVAVSSLGSLIGLIVIVTGPGSAVRGQFQHAHIGLSATFPSVVHNARFLLHDVRNATVLLPVALGLLARRLLGSPRSWTTRRWLAVWGAFMIAVPLVIVALMTTYAGSTEGGVAPYRAAFLMTFAAAFGVALLSYVVASWCRFELSPLAAGCALTLVTGLGVAALYHQARPVIRAETKYAARIAQRAALIKSELAAGRTTITLLPAPLLYQRTQAFDLAFNDPNHHDSGSWLLRFMPRYYDIPTRDRIEIPTAQPAAYCLPGVAVPWAGVAPCEQLKTS
jgi:hypothetical protein